MKKEYKGVYDLVNSLGFSPAYIKFKNGYYSLEVFSLNYSPLGKGQKFCFYDVELEGLKEQIEINLKQDCDEYPSLNEGRLF